MTDATESRHRRTAALAYSRMMRNHEIHLTHGGKLVRAIVCLDTDPLGTMLASMSRHNPDGGTTAVFYPLEHCFRFMDWQPRDIENSTPLDSHIDTTIGMAIAAIEAEQSGWTARIPKFSTAEIEKQLTAV